MGGRESNSLRAPRLDPVTSHSTMQALERPDPQIHETLAYVSVLCGLKSHSPAPRSWVTRVRSPHRNRFEAHWQHVSAESLRSSQPMSPAISAVIARESPIPRLVLHTLPTAITESCAANAVMWKPDLVFATTSAPTLKTDGGFRLPISPLPCTSWLQPPVALNAAASSGSNFSMAATVVITAHLVTGTIQHDCPNLTGYWLPSNVSISHKQRQSLTGAATLKSTVSRQS
ncbi:hypothetical protein DFP72DRAFT_1167254 [Ephemerocybe angulata]|uniref:Uncharacterized protein n=1 Tax=Ephemerocybe angulata TaxID=980116 RepID=A0A8H6I4R6_9AGAR|nr:hypothetical protein DFP72DRAFT_1167254 [Tulosesus angulatus]